MLDLLKRRKFSSIVCIDDDNASPLVNSVESFADALVNVSPRKRKNLVTADAGLQECCNTAGDLAEPDLEARKAGVRAVLEVMRDTGELTGDRMAAAAAVLFQGYAGSTQKLLRKVFEGDGVAFSAYSFGGWQEQKAEIIALAGQDSKILMLVDEVNDNEPNVDLDGEGVLADMLSIYGESVPFIDAIIVTSNCNPDDELTESHKVYASIAEELRERGVDPSFKKVFVLSKDRLSRTDLSESFVVHLNRIEASRLSIALSDATKAVLNGAVDESLDWLKQIPLMEFHNSVFVTAQNEGAAEIDTLVRMASIRQRSALEKVLRENPSVQGYIEEMRKFPIGGFGGSMPSASNSVLRELRDLEFERPADHINILHAPLACGDVFSIRTEDSQGDAQEFTAMLLVNPCDMVLRQNGHRKLTTGLLVQIKKVSNQEATKILTQEKLSSPLLYRIATGTGDEDFSYLFYNSKIEAVPLSVLDLCWTNAGGSADLKPDDLAASFGALTPPQQARIQVLVARAESKRFARVELWGTELEVLMEDFAETLIGSVSAKNRVKYSVTRTWRFAPEFAAAALSALSQALARPAFGHDYLHH
ncbi:hypothetical protein SBP18_18060 [Rhodoferax ferrireducens]|uniref:hypothetical protein n=1 Tax=Rhodoferax ferrireducens TaxID=192843 RepID=UPI00298D6530|nr:hypothetical protein [Rhodoferax ferrireducens]WPC66368.1 hypothetical protein SBP18_18060 [Rhodoferax ferrireducens]